MKDKLIQAFTSLGDSIIAVVPKVLVGILLIVGALLVAKIIERSLRYMLTKARFDSLVGKVGVDRALQRLGLRQELSTLIPRLAYFLVLLLLARTAVDALGLTAISSAIGTFFGYLPNVVAALLLLILGGALGQFAGDTVARSAEASGIEFAPSLGKLVSGLVVFVSAMMAIAQLKIDTDIVRIVTSFILGAGALALVFHLDSERGISFATLRPVFTPGKSSPSAGPWRSPASVARCAPSRRHTSFWSPATKAPQWRTRSCLIRLPNNDFLECEPLLGARFLRNGIARAAGQDTRLRARMKTRLDHFTWLGIDPSTRCETVVWLHRCRATPKAENQWWHRPNRSPDTGSTSGPALERRSRRRARICWSA